MSEPANQVCRAQQPPRPDQPISYLCCLDRGHEGAHRAYVFGEEGVEMVGGWPQHLDPEATTAQILAILNTHTHEDASRILQAVAITLLDDKLQICGWCFTSYYTVEEARDCALKCGPKSAFNLQPTIDSDPCVGGRCIDPAAHAEGAHEV